MYTPFHQRSSSGGSSRQFDYPRPLTSHRPSTSHTSTSRTRRPSSSSRPLSQLSFTVLRKSPARRPVIGTPSDFRKVQSGRISPVRKAPTFRPLQLSIYIPGNELPDLPVFWEDGIKKMGDEVDGVERPAQALVKSRSDPMLLRRPSSTFSIPRKPLASRSSSTTFDYRYSMESTFTLNTISDFPKPPKSRSFDQSRPEYPKRRSSIAATQSTQDFLDALDSRLPQPPPVAVRSNSEPSYTVYRRASEQSLRLRTHLEERQSLEKRLPDLLEETSPLSPKSKEPKAPLSPISDHDSTFESDLVTEKAGRSWFETSISVPDPKTTHQPHSSDGSSTLLDPPTLVLDPFHPDASKPRVTITNRSETPNSLRNRLSAWLLKALPNLPPIEINLDSKPNRRPSSTPMSLYSVSAKTVHTKQSSTSSYWDFGRGSVDMEKAILPANRAVGVAF